MGNLDAEEFCTVDGIMNVQQTNWFAVFIKIEHVDITQRFIVVDITQKFLQKESTQNYGTKKIQLSKIKIILPVISIYIISNIS